MQPFIHLFKTPKNHYFDDVNKNENVRIEQELYDYVLLAIKKQKDFN